MIYPWRASLIGTLAWLLAVVGLTAAGGPPAGRSGAESRAFSPVHARELLNEYCVTCHSQRAKVGGLALESIDVANVGAQAEVWEKVIRKLRAGLMPPLTASRRPGEAASDSLAAWIETEIDRAAAAHPNAGRTEALHRLNRVEYGNAIRDVLALDIDVASLLPTDSASYGFDNVASALKFSESLMERYLSAARTVSRTALGISPGVVAQRYKVTPALPQVERLEQLPFGTRGGALVEHAFPQDGEYQIRIAVKNPRAGGTSLVDVRLDGQRVRGLDLTDQHDFADSATGAVAEFRLPVTAGPHAIGVAFVAASLLPESKRIPFLNPTVSRSPVAQGVEDITITGPFGPTGGGDTPSRRRIFVCRPATQAEEPACARRIVSTLARRAYRRPVAGEDVAVLLEAYATGRTSGDFEAGIQKALEQVLVSPNFLFRIETAPQRARSGGPNYRVTDLELASRLSFFLWSSVPDDELLRAAETGRLKDPTILAQQVRRMLADPRTEELTVNFAGQWLGLRNLDSTIPSEVLFPDFNEGLRRAFRRETELFFDSILDENRSVTELLTADYTFVNGPLAAHYGIPNVKGSHFRRVHVADPNRRGLLGQGSILAITSAPVRTSPVQRGKWILMNILGSPPPPPPANVPPLPDRQGASAGKAGSMRDRMAAHRANPVCASCHATIDPLGFALEKFDAVGRWRDRDDTYAPIDTSGVMPDGTKFNGVVDLRRALVRKPEQFVTTVTERLLTYALGRGVEYYDMPAVRGIVRDTAPGYEMRDVVLGIVKSLPFQMRRAVAPSPLSVAVN